MIAAVKRELPDLGALGVSDYEKGVVNRATFDELLRACVTAEGPVALDPKNFDLTGAGLVTLITPNEREAERSSGYHVDSDVSAEIAGRRLIETMGARNVLITLGEHGMSLACDNGSVMHMPFLSKEVYDVTGAGDTVVAVLAWRWPLAKM
jgi:D-beta-D-heptose 7-phosphate kinase / D-beta-D-heptose 1-phosphate adenosyltransferase